MTQIAPRLLSLLWLCCACTLRLAHGQAPQPLPPNPYVVDEQFRLEVPSELGRFGAVIGARVAPNGTLYVFHRCGANSCAGRPTVPPLLKYAPSGKLLDALGAGMFVWPHALYTDREGNIWLSDAVASDGRDPSAPGRGHQVFKLSPDGKVLLTLGKAGQAGSGSDTFFAPSDVVVASNGDIFVADGHGGGTNARIVKFNRDGKYLKEWGTYGSGPGDFTVPHAIAMDSTGRIFVGDRNNNRIQIFDQDGKFLDEWKQFGRPSGMYIDKNDTLYVTDTQPIFGRPGFQNGIYIGSTRDGKVSGFIPKINELSNMEGIGGTADGSVLFGAEIGLNRIVKFVRR